MCQNIIGLDSLTVRHIKYIAHEVRLAGHRGNMKYLRLSTLDPYLNLAIEEYLFNTEHDDVLMLWQNAPSVIVGKNQNIRAEVDMAALHRYEVLPVRRITGGGAVYHDAGNINYTFISAGNGGIDFATFSRPIIDALGSLGIALSLSGRNDLCLADGRKVSGNAQCAKGGRVLHHGTLLFAGDLERLGKILTPDPEKLKTKAVKSTRARVANLSELLPDLKSAGELMDKIEDYILSTMHPAVIEAPACAEVIALRERNASDEWLYPSHGISAECTVTRKKRYPFGSVEAELAIVGERIKSVRIYGDFFGTEPIERLEALIAGHTPSELSEILTDEAVGSSVAGLRAKELVDLIFG